MLRIQTLGAPSFLADAHVVELRSKKHAGLLLYLACHSGKHVPRDRLTELLWPDSGPAKARHSISQAAYSLRSAFPSLCLELQRDFVRIPEATLELDVAELRAAIAQNDFAKVRHLDVGDFLDNFWVENCPYYSEWQEAERFDLRADLAAFYRTICRAGEKAGDWERVALAAESLIRIEPYDEPAYQHLIRASLHRGHADQARKWLQRSDHQLLELGRHLSPATETMRRLIEDLELALSVEENTNNSFTPFVGRATEFAELARLYDVVVAGKGQAALVMGEAGIGKTRLCQRLLRYGAISGARVIHAACYETEQQLPFNGVIDAFRDCITIDDLSNLEQPWKELVSELLPETLRIERSTLLDTSLTAQSRRFEAVVQLLFGMADVRPVILLLEDIHWSSPSTSALLHYVVRRTAEARVMVIASLRPGDLPADGGRPSLVSPKSRFRSIPLGPLDHVESHALIDAIRNRLHTSLNETNADRIVELSGGRPFLLVECLTELAQQNASQLDASLIPTAVQSYVADSLLRLSPFAAFISQCLSVSDKHITLTSLAGVAGSSLSNVFQAIDELEHRSLIQRASQGVRLTHDIFREYIYASLNEDARIAIHKAIAETLTREDERPGLLAFHFDKARIRDRALTCALQAIDEARWLDASSDAEESIKIAIRNARPDDSALFVRLAMVLGRNGKIAEAEALYLRERGRLANQSDTKEKLQIELELLRLSARRRVTDGIFDELDLLVERAELIGDSDTLIRASQIGIELCHSAGSQRIDGHLNRLVRLSSTNETQSEMAVEGMLAAARVGALTGNPQRGLQLADHMLDAARSLKSSELIVCALSARGLSQLQLGHLAASCRSLEEAYALAAEKGIFYSQWNLLNSFGVVLLELGDYQRSEQILKQASELAEQLDSNLLVVFARINLALLYFEQGRLADAKNAALHILTYELFASAWWNRVLAHSVLGLICLSSNELDTARDYGRQVSKALSGNQDYTPDLSYAFVFLARLLHGSRPTDAINALNDAIDVSASGDPCGVLRLKLERAKVLVSIHDPSATQECEAIVATAERMGAEPMRLRAIDLLRSMQPAQLIS